MEKIIGDYSTELKMTGDEAKDICKLGKGEDCCAFLVCGSGGFECIRLSYPANGHIFKRLEDGTMNAKGHGGWGGCGGLFDALGSVVGQVVEVVEHPEKPLLLKRLMIRPKVNLAGLLQVSVMVPMD